MTWPSTRIGQFLTTKVHKIVLPISVTTAKFVSKASGSRQLALAKQYKTNKCVALESKRTKALPNEMGRVPDTTLFEAVASPGVKAYTRADAVVLCPSGLLGYWQDSYNPLRYVLVSCTCSKLITRRGNSRNASYHTFGTMGVACPLLGYGIAETYNPSLLVG